VLGIAVYRNYEKAMLAREAREWALATALREQTQKAAREAMDALELRLAANPAVENLDVDALLSRWGETDAQPHSSLYLPEIEKIKEDAGGLLSPKDQARLQKLYVRAEELEWLYSGEARYALAAYDFKDYPRGFPPLKSSHPTEDRLIHLWMAAIYGNQGALDLLVDAFFVPRSIPDTDYLTFDVVSFSSMLDKVLAYYQKNPVNGREPLTVAPRRLSLIRKAAEAGPLDDEELLYAYHAWNLSGAKGRYSPEMLWDAAWYASDESWSPYSGVDRRPPDMRLVLRLIARGGPMLSGDKERAIEEYYALWKSGEFQRFFPMEYGGDRCGPDNASITYQEISYTEYKRIKKQKELQTFAAALSPEVQKLLKAEEEAFYTCLEEKANYGEMWDGSSSEASAATSIRKQNEEHVATLKKLLTKEMSIPEYPDNEEELQKVYAAKMVEGKRYLSRESFYPEQVALGVIDLYYKSLPHAQDLWLTYRAAMVRLLAAARPDINPENVKRLITEKRIQYLHRPLPWDDSESLL
jgi:hypothetical protein